MSAIVSNSVFKLKPPKEISVSFRTVERRRLNRR